MKNRMRIQNVLVGVTFMLTTLTVTFFWLNSPLRAIIIVQFDKKDSMEEILSESGVRVQFPNAGRFGSAVTIIENPNRLIEEEDQIFQTVARRGFFCRIRYVKRWKFLNRERSTGDPDVIGLGRQVDEETENQGPPNLPTPMDGLREQ